MKKSVIAAGAASVALAALPVVATFAATSVVDTINVTVTDTCTVNRTAGEGTYNTAILPNTVSENFASSTFTASCNDYSSGDVVVNITAEFTELTTGDASTAIPYSSNAVVAGTSSWRAALGDYSATATGLAATDNIFPTTPITEDQTATVWYSVGAASDQANGTYTGYAIYTLAEN